MSIIIHTREAKDAPERQEAQIKGDEALLEARPVPRIIWIVRTIPVDEIRVVRRIWDVVRGSHFFLILSVYLQNASTLFVALFPCLLATLAVVMDNSLAAGGTTASGMTDVIRSQELAIPPTWVELAVDFFAGCIVPLVSALSAKHASFRRSRLN